tara:strand:- start:258 stop:902 length:645 start_codon:yes stop_codon:yes gene_type:complete
MKKQEIKKDPIRDRMIGIINSVNDDPKRFFQYLMCIAILLLAIIFYSNSRSNRLNEYNLYSSINQNRYIDGDRETAILNFDKILSEFSKSESYNQALIYSLNNALEENDNEMIQKLLDSNSFSTSDNTLQGLFYNILGNYYLNVNNEDAVSYYMKAIKTTDIDAHKHQFTLNLLYYYYDSNNLTDYTDLLETIDIELIKSFQMKAKYEQLPTVN